MTVFFEETGKERVLKAVCQRCAPGAKLEGYDVRLVSPYGIVHESSEGEKTDCGWDATGDDWWWRL